jgi:hypothetical protein
MAGKKANQKLQAWSEARARHHLTEAQVQMARELGLNPAQLGQIDNQPEFIEDTYRKRFGKATPDVGNSVEERAREEPTKRKAPSIKQDRSHAPGRESRESPRGSTIPPFPKQRIDD